MSLIFFTKNEVNPTNGLGGVRAHTNKQTDKKKQTGYQYYNIDTADCSRLLFMLYIYTNKTT